MSLLRSFLLRLGNITKLAKMENAAAVTAQAVLPESSIPEMNGVKRTQEAENSEHPDKKLKTEVVFRKRKCALLLSYCGHEYWGMQKNPNVPTIEEELLKAMIKADLISKENFESPQTLNFQRAARTDKGVSAARQIVSIRLPPFENLKEKINQFLPSCIRVQDMKRTTKGFNSKYWCDARTYSYTLPTFAFASATEVTNENYRIDEATLERVNSILKMFVGTRNFHNFTSGRKFNDPSAIRYIMDFQCGKPFIEDNLEMVVATVKGQSFMLHQIRKMIGLTIAIMRDLAEVNVMERVWDAPKFHIPLAPGLGLVLEQLHYDKYNKRYGHDGIHELLVWDNLQEEIEAFKKQYIYITIIKVENESKSMFKWLAALPTHTYEERLEDNTNRWTAVGKAENLVTRTNENEESVEGIEKQNSDE